MTTAGILVGSIDEHAFYTALLGVAALGGITVFFLTAIAIPVYLRRSGNHRGHLAKPVILAPCRGVGFSVTLVLSILNFPVLTGGSPTVSNLLLILVYGVFVGGFLLTLALRRWRPEVYERIGRQ